MRDLAVRPSDTSPSRTLSKSDYKVARSCATKLYYKELGYPSNRDSNPYLALLADGAYMVEKMARLLFPSGYPISQDSGPEVSARLAADALRAKEVTIFEGTFVSRGKLARVDILEKVDTTLNLIEVKSGSYSTVDELARAASGLPNPLRTNKGAIRADWLEYLHDIAFQVIILKELYPDLTVRPFLALADRDKRSTADAIHQQFHIHRERLSNGRIKTHVDFTGDADRLRLDHLIAMVDLSTEVEEIVDEVRLAAEGYLATLVPDLRKAPASISIDCRTCEYRLSVDRNRHTAENGFLECWGNLGTVEPHLLDLCYVGTIGPKNNPITNQLIRQGRCSLYDLTPADLVKADGEIGARNRRQLVQIEHTRDGTIWMSDDLKRFVGEQRYPLHFIDFETSALAVPYHAGMRPFETVAFQWSCHTVASPGATPAHAEWINDRDFFPNFEFARTLRDQVRGDGTVFMWAHHERTVLRHIRLQMTQYANGYGALDPTVADWIDELAGAKGSHDGRIVDLNQKTVDGYFHPAMKGRTSIKWVLAAVWEADPMVRRQFSRYERYDKGRLLDPYDALDPIEIAGSRIEVIEGTEAMRAYQEMIYGTSRDDPAARELYRRLLLQYCELDSAAMVMIWMHWLGLLAS